MRKSVSARAKKLVRWHNSYVIFVTPEVKALGWNERTIVKVSLLKDEKKIVIEKGMEL
jgi:hypothetical protein